MSEEDFKISGQYDPSKEVAALTVLVAVLIARLGGKVEVSHEEADSVLDMGLNFSQTPTATTVELVE